MAKNKNVGKNGIVIYEDKGKKISVEATLRNETIWLTQVEIASLFQSERSVITKHLRNIFDSGELEEKSNVQKMHIANSDKPVKFYDLDAILSVGYRVNSKRATQFRIWATKTLREHILKGYTINQNRLLEDRRKFEQLQNAITFLRKKSKTEMLAGQEGEMLDLLAHYSETLSLLEQYDTNRIRKARGRKAKFKINYEHCQGIIKELKRELSAKGNIGNLFGIERNGAFQGIVGNLYQTFSGKELYSDVISKAANLLYLTVKDHSFSDGNKRIGSFLFVYFLDKNNYLFRENGERKISDNALVALALLVAESQPNEKDTMIALISQLIK
ncbi:MAG: RhuM family protein [Candidatus Jorgensenbacteria bacterium]